MRTRALFALALLAGACSRALPGKPSPGDIPVRPDQVERFDVLYGKNCAACHGAEGEGGPALGLANPLYLALADDAVIRKTTATGVKGTAMPAFAMSAGGTLTDKQVDVIVTGIRAHWGRGEKISLPYSAPLGDAARGADVFEKSCASCHPGGGKVVDPTYLSLVSDQSLRTTVIAGRPDLGQPDGRALSEREVSDVVAWLASKRPPR